MNHFFQTTFYKVTYSFTISIRSVKFKLQIKFFLVVSLVQLNSDRFSGSKPLLPDSKKRINKVQTFDTPEKK